MAKICPCCKDIDDGEGHIPMTIQYNCPECNHFWSDEWCSAVDGECPQCETDNISLISWEEWEAEIEEETEEEHAVRLRRISDEIKADMKAGRYRNGQLHPHISAKKQTEELVERPKFHEWQREIMELLMSTPILPQMYGGRTISGRYSSHRPPFHELYGGEIKRISESPSFPERIMLRDEALSGKTFKFDSIIMDEFHDIKPEDYFRKMHMADFSKIEERVGQELDGPKKPYWTQPIPDAKQPKPVSSPSEELRAKRRAKRKKKK